MGEDKFLFIVLFNISRLLNLDVLSHSIILVSHNVPKMLYARVAPHNSSLGNYLDFLGWKKAIHLVLHLTGFGSVLNFRL